ncbi:hypothetical protein OU5_P0407 (plasmid) [Pseudomonas mandelii JR-1]|jgi:hypothetical protein|uniref:Uncharacterized protein n=2 Tax=Pseudomonas TaxID=286 RepID=A0A024EL92_9PSED|nr:MULTISPECIES: hypothetical protein [Pseudomonas]AHZ73659.1 hypothetical protein OU5_P0407 [Pseudomonas mandelii JR-1]MBC2384519.1 hypothetical protein [Pseudomonas cremoris]
MEILLYIIAMFGGSYQYDPQFFWSLMAFLVLAALAILWGIARVGKGLDRSKN